jgi:hypothetical protein
LTVTTIGPVVALIGTMATICVSLQLRTIATTPLKVIELVDDWLAPKLVPVTVTLSPPKALEGEMEVTADAGGATITVTDDDVAGL